MSKLLCKCNTLHASFFTLMTIFVLSGHLSFAQCNTFLNVQAAKSGVAIGDLDVTGTAITVEAVFERTTTYDPTYQGGELVSKHRDPNDVNYLLRPNAAGITTTTGFHQIVAPCNIEVGKLYHAALVYDGSSLKFYRNGDLVGQIPVTGSLIINDWPTRIGASAYLSTIYPVDFFGYINEVRIWNVARTQAQLKSYMNITLPNPATQTGLQAYYTFNSLVNKQGNTAWNGTVFGTASINQTSPACLTPTVSCNSFLNVQAVKSGVSIGDLDVTGNIITVEALFERTTAYDPAYQGGELVSKHRDPDDVNYLLRPNTAAITTTNGFYQIVAPCDVKLNTVYHAALVYDGSSLKFYRNGDLIGQVAASGDLITNDWPTRIGASAFLSTIYPVDFFGYINEVRIWKAARTQAQIKAYMETALPGPATQAGLQAYYTFNSLVNKQGNTAWNGTVFGTASINQSATYCSWNLASSPGYCTCDSSVVPDSLARTVVNKPINSVKADPDNSSVIVYPNPAKSEVKIEINAQRKERLTLRLVNVSGQTVTVQRNDLVQGKNTIVLNAPGKLKSGVYIIQLQYGNKTVTKKLVVN